MSIKTLYFHLEKGDFMLKNTNGFTFVEALVGLNIVLVILFTVSMVVNTVYYERMILYERRTISSTLHDELQSFIYGSNTLPSKKTEKINHTKVTVQFHNLTDRYIEACATWNNIKKREEEVCLYGIPINE